MDDNNGLSSGMEGRKETVEWMEWNGAWMDKGRNSRNGRMDGPSGRDGNQVRLLWQPIEQVPYTKVIAFNATAIAGMIIHKATAIYKWWII